VSNGLKPRERQVIRLPPPRLPRPDLFRGAFRTAYAANVVGQLGNSLQFVAVLWYAGSAGPLGIVGVRVADTLPALLFGLHAGVVADRWPRRRTVVWANVVAGAALTPLAVAGATGHVPVWALAVVGFTVVATISYFTPAFGALLPSLVGRARVQQANALLSGSYAVVGVAGQAAAAGLLTTLSAGDFFAVNAASFFVSATLLARLPHHADAPDLAAAAEPAGGFGAVRVRPGLRTAIAMMALGTTVMTGVWTVGIVELARNRYGGASSLSLLLMATAVGTIAATALLSRIALRRKVRASALVWILLPVGYALIAYAPALLVAMVGTAIVGATTAASIVLLTASAQESVPRSSLGRVLALIFLANVGSKPFGLLVLGPAFTVAGVRTMFDAGGAAVFVAALVAVALIRRSTVRDRRLAAGARVGALRPGRSASR
jgi:hypothetical protein